MRPSGGKLKRHGAWVVLLGCAILLCSSAEAKVEEDLDYGNVYAIQTRPYKMNHEFTLSLSFLPLDAFFKYFGVTGHYVFHFNDLWAWEAIHFTYTQYTTINTGLKGELNKLSATPTDTPRLNLIMDTNLMIKPFYGKIALLNNMVIYSETYFLIGVGTEKFETAWFPGFDFGVGMRVFLNNKFSLRFEAREYMYIQNGGVNSTIYLGVGFCYNAFADEDKIKRVKPATGVAP